MISAIVCRDMSGIHHACCLACAALKGAHWKCNTTRGGFPRSHVYVMPIHGMIQQSTEQNGTFHCFPRRPPTINHMQVMLK